MGVRWCGRWKESVGGAGRGRRAGRMRVDWCPRLARVANSIPQVGTKLHYLKGNCCLKKNLILLS